MHGWGRVKSNLKHGGCSGVYTLSKYNRLTALLAFIFSASIDILLWDMTARRFALVIVTNLQMVFNSSIVKEDKLYRHGYEDMHRLAKKSIHNAPISQEFTFESFKNPRQN
jgi:hypothetical protein